MKFHKKYYLNDKKLFKDQLLIWSDNYEVSAFLDSSSFSEKNKNTLLYNQFDCILAVGIEDEIYSDGPDSFSLLQDFYERNEDWIFGILSYDLKNEIEKLGSINEDKILFPNMHFFKARKLFVIKDIYVEVFYSESLENNHNDSDFEEINNIVINTKTTGTGIDIKEIKSRFTKTEYIETIKKLKSHIQYGDIYEVNLCQEFYIDNIVISPLILYQTLKRVSPTPFSSYYRLYNKYLISASPERFLKKTGNKICSQPIKGTAPRHADEQFDKKQAEMLRNDPKEISENVMIVDLVRNDLSKTAVKGSVNVDELFGIYSFAQVHQMISTISSKLRSEISVSQVIKQAFPMGSMTGAPKIRAMELIEQYEKTKRGLYSGSVGYIDPEGNFDFNVIIRSILYNSTNKYLSYIVGGAITSESVPEKEYEECMIKAKAMKETLCNSKLSND